MRVLLVLSLLCAFNFKNNEVSAEDSWIGWHGKVGIHEAERIRKAELSFAFGPMSPIVGGALAPVNAHPYLAGVLIDIIGLPGPSACGGSLLSGNRVLTAAHCWNDGRFNAWRFTVVLGSQFLFHGGLRVPTNTIGVHPHYNPRTLANDIAILYLPVHVTFTDSIRPIALPSARHVNVDFTGLWARASGYGRYSDLTLPTTNTMVRNIWLQTITLAQCRAVYGGVVLDSNICTNGAGGVGICQGDSGGPLVLNFEGQNILIGVSSFTVAYGCELGFPSAFARVTSFLDWIHWHLM